MIPALITALGSAWPRALGWLALGATILLFTIGARRSCEKAGRAAERLQQAERTRNAHERILEAGTDRPRDRDDLARRLRQGGF